MSSFVLKIIGIIAMICDHSGDVFLKHFSYLNLIGRFAFPIFAFQAAVGYSNTKDFKKYIFRLLIFAIISQAPFMLFTSTYDNNFSLNIFFTLLLGVCTLYIYDKCNKKILGIIAVIIISVIAELIKVDYGAFGILTIFIFYLFKDKKLLMVFYFIPLCFFKYVPDIAKAPFLYKTYLQLATATALPITFILLYNKKQGPKLKYFFYLFYPVHLLVLWLINMFI